MQPFQGPVRKQTSSSFDENLPRSMKPSIPEPRHRVGPEGVSSGISFRRLPQASLNEIRKICEHYEAKCEGQYESLASRYILQMGYEIRAQISQIEHGTSQSCARTCPLVKPKQALQENKDKTSQMLSIEKNNPLGDERLAHMNRRSFRNKVEVLENALREAKDELMQYKDKTLQRNENYHGMKKNYNDCYRDLKALRGALEDEKKKHASEMEKVKSDTKRIIKFVRTKANEALKDIETKHQESIENLNQNLLQQENEYKNHVSAHLENLENQVSEAVRSEKAAIEKGMYCIEHKNSRILRSSHTENIPLQKSQRFFSDDTVSAVSADFPIDGSQDDKVLKRPNSSVESLEGLADSIMNNLRIGFQSILDGTQKEPNDDFDQIMGSQRSKSIRESKKKRPPNIIST